MGKKVLYVSLMVTSLLLLSGCGDNEDVKNDEVTSSESTTSTESVTTNSTIESAKVLLDDTTTTNDSTVMTTKESTTKNVETSTSKTTNKSVATTTAKVTTSAKKSCTAKKFSKNKYSYVYETEAECKKQGNNDFFTISDNVNDQVFSYDCEKVIDECGTTWYGVVFYVFDSNDSPTPVYY